MKGDDGRSQEGPGVHLPTEEGRRKERHQGGEGGEDSVCEELEEKPRPISLSGEEPAEAFKLAVSQEATE